MIGFTERPWEEHYGEKQRQNSRSLCHQLVGELRSVTSPLCLPSSPSCDLLTAHLEALNDLPHSTHIHKHPLCTGAFRRRNQELQSSRPPSQKQELGG
jgi:hypothetical protein